MDLVPAVCVVSAPAVSSNPLAESAGERKVLGSGFLSTNAILLPTANAATLPEFETADQSLCFAADLVEFA